MPIRLHLFAALALIAVSLTSAGAGEISARPGWVIHKSSKSYDQLLQAIRTAASDNSLRVVTSAGPTKAAAARGISIPGNRVLGVFNNDFAVKILSLSTAAMIEAPLRLYVTEDPGGSATLSYKRPSHVFAPYFDEGGAELRRLANDLDLRFAQIAQQALD